MAFPIRPRPTRPSVFPRIGRTTAIPSAFADEPIVEGDPAQHGEHEAERLLGHALVIGAGRDRDRDLPLGCRGERDAVVADARAGDHAEVRRGRDGFGRDPLAPGDDGVALREVFEELSLGEWGEAGQVNRPEPGGDEAVAELAGLIADGTCTDQDAGHRDDSDS